MSETSSDLPCGEAPAPVMTPHFPTTYQAVIWRNWPMITPTRLARVLGTTDDTVTHEAHRMGLGRPASGDTERLWLKRGYITLIRQNWHLLPYEQLLALLDWRADQMAYALKEDDFLWTKLGRLKPATPPVTCQPLTPDQQAATATLRAVVDASFGDIHTEPRERPFDFLKTLVAPSPSPSSSQPQRRAAFGLKLAYSYCAVYGDPLLDPDLDPYPEGLLARLADHGINAVWLHAVLYTLVPWLGDADYSAEQHKRLANLNALVEKAAKFGIGVYLYLNEPRGMPPAFFNDRPEWKGAYYPATDLIAMCMTIPDVGARLQGGVRTLFGQAPGLAGVFTITMSENLTHCHSKGARVEACPRCASRPAADLVAQVNNTIAAGIHAVKPQADVIAWNWGWHESWSQSVIDQLRPDVKVMCTSETYLPTDAMGVKGRVSDYTISKVGPGDHARQTWRHATDRGLGVIAKVQLNNTWECSAVPYLPVPFLIKRHLRNLEAEHVSGLMVSWTLGGYPGGNMALTDHEPEDLAVAQFGAAAASQIIDAWRKFGDAFEHFPLSGTGTLYTAPQNYGPMNLLYAQPTGYAATMVGFPYDDLMRWRGNHFPEPVFEAQFQKLSDGWAAALTILQSAAPQITPDKQENFEELLRIAQAAYCHFRSTYLQIRFVRLRGNDDSQGFPEEIIHLLDEEIALATTLRDICRHDSRIGFEATNHYYYTEATLMEKVLNCAYLKAMYQQSVLRRALDA